MVIGEFTSTAARVGRTPTGAGLATTAQVAAAGSFAAMRDASIDPGIRVQMENRGKSIVTANPNLQRAIQALGSDAVAVRGFNIAVGVLGSGEYTQAGMRANLAAAVDPVTGARRDPAATASILAGFDAGVTAFTGRGSLVQGPGSPSSGSEDGGVPRAVVIGGAALVVGVAAFFVLRRR